MAAKSLPAKLLARVLDPLNWALPLDRFGRTMNVAVAMSNVSGQILGECKNPQPLWLLARQSADLDRTGCPFCILPKTPCRIVKESLLTGKVTHVTDAAGLAHVAVPLFLEGKHLGALIAGQVFTEYPQPLHLERVANRLHVSIQRMWKAATERPPIRPVTLHAYGELLELLGQALVGKLYTDILSAKLQDALADKTVLLQEVHHRVKNNMAVVSSLLSLQASMSNAETASHLRESQMRIMSMASIHEHLYGSENLRQIRFDAYARELAAHLSALHAAEHVRIEMIVDEIGLSIDKSIPCGLILNELLMNVFKHAFPEGRPGVITIGLEVGKRGMVRMSVQDNGIGLPDTFETGVSHSLGLRIIQILTDQLGGEFTVHRDGGTRLEIAFPLNAA